MQAPASAYASPSASPRPPPVAPPQKSWWSKNWKLVLAFLLGVLGVVFVVLGAVEYSQYHKETDKNTTEAKNKKDNATLFFIIGAAVLIVAVLAAVFAKRV